MNLSWTVWHMLIPAPKTLRQEGCEFKTSLGYIARSCLKISKYILKNQSIPFLFIYLCEVIFFCHIYRLFDNFRCCPGTSHARPLSYAPNHKCLSLVGYNCCFKYIVGDPYLWQ